MNLTYARTSAKVLAIPSANFISFEPVNFNGRANNRAAQTICFRVKGVHGEFLQKQTKETKNIRQEILAFCEPQ